MNASVPRIVPVDLPANSHFQWYLDTPTIHSADIDLGLGAIQPVLGGGLATRIGNDRGFFYLMPVSEERTIGEHSEPIDYILIHQ